MAPVAFITNEQGGHAERSAGYAPIPGVRVLGLTGAARHGKDTAAAAIVAVTPGAKVYALSDAISVVCRVFHGMTRRDPPLLQRVGFDQRLHDPAVWLDALYWKIDEDRPPLAIITGVRFPDEADMVRFMGGTVIRIRRVTDHGLPYTATDRDPAHPVEQHMQGIPVADEWLNEDGHPERLVKQARAWAA